MGTYSNLIKSLFWASSIKCLNPTRRSLKYFYHLIASNREHNFGTIFSSSARIFWGKLLTFQILIICHPKWNFREIILTHSLHSLSSRSSSALFVCLFIAVVCLLHELPQVALMMLKGDCCGIGLS